MNIKELKGKLNDRVTEMCMDWSELEAFEEYKSNEKYKAIENEILELQNSIGDKINKKDLMRLEELQAELEEIKEIIIYKQGFFKCLEMVLNKEL